MYRRLRLVSGAAEVARRGRRDLRDVARPPGTLARHERDRPGDCGVPATGPRLSRLPRSSPRCEQRVERPSTPSTRCASGRPVELREHEPRLSAERRGDDGAFGRRARASAHVRGRLAAVRSSDHEPTPHPTPPPECATLRAAEADRGASVPCYPAYRHLAALESGCSASGAAGRRSRRVGSPPTDAPRPHPHDELGSAAPMATPAASGSRRPDAHHAPSQGAAAARSARRRGSAAGAPAGRCEVARDRGSPMPRRARTWARAVADDGVHRCERADVRHAKHGHPQAQAGCARRRGSSPAGQTNRRGHAGRTTGRGWRGICGARTRSASAAMLTPSSAPPGSHLGRDR